MTRLNRQQLDVLQWIADGTPERVWPDFGHRTSARALANRGLVKVRGHGPTWRAQLTDMGRAFLADEPVDSRRSRTAPRLRTTRAKAANPPDLTGARLVEQLIDVGGSLRVADPGREVRAAYRRALASVSSGSIPAGKRITYRGRDRGDLVIELVDAVEPAPEGDRPIPIPQALSPDDALIRHLMQHPELIAVSDASRERALLLVQALAEESRRRGHLARPADRATLEFVIRGKAIGATIAEEKVKVSQVPADQVAAAKYDWQRIPAVEMLAFNGQLALTLLTTNWKPPTWADRQRWTLDSRLPQVTRRAEETIEARLQAREQEEHARAERRRLWEEAVPRARRDYVDHLNRNRLDQQVAEHAKSQALRAYAAAIQERVMQLSDGQEREEAVAWVEWMRVEAQRLDPLVDPQALRYVIPDELPVSEVSKFMPRGMSAYHPPD